MIINRIIIVPIALLVLYLYGGLAHADEKKPSIPKFQIEKKSIGENDLTLVRQLMKRGAFMSAANLLEEMYSSGRKQADIINLLLDCYRELKAYEKSELLLLQQIVAFPFALQYHDRLFDVYLKYGVDSLIEVQMERMFENFPGNPDIYLAIIKKFTRQGYTEKAFELISKGREEFGSDYLFASESALLYETRGEYYNAVFEYFKLLSADTSATRLGVRRLSVLVRHPGAPPEVIRALTDILDSLPNNEHALRVLQEAYIKDNRFIEAFDLCIKLDSVTNQNGSNIFQYMRHCHERKLYEQVLKAAEFIDSMDVEKKPFADYKFYYAAALTGLEKFSQAKKTYGFIIKNYPSKRDKAEALLLTGNLYRYNLLNYDSARVYYEWLEEYSMIPQVFLRARQEIALLFLVEGDLQEAEKAFSELSNLSSNNEQKEKIAYQLAMIQFYKKNYNDADLLFKKVMAEYPRGFYVNDALINSLIITESQIGFEDVLSLYAEALYFEIRMLPDSVEAAFKSVIDRGFTPLIGLSSYRLAKFYIDRADTIAAVLTIGEMEDKYSEDYFYPYALKLKADIIFYELRINEAAEIYRHILENYNTYPFAPEIRNRLQEIGQRESAS